MRGARDFFLQLNALNSRKATVVQAKTGHSDELMMVARKSLVRPEQIIYLFTSSMLSAH
jgi:hypothetical protein